MCYSSSKRHNHGKTKFVLETCGLRTGFLLVALIILYTSRSRILGSAPTVGRQKPEDLHLKWGQYTCLSQTCWDRTCTLPMDHISMWQRTIHLPKTMRTARPISCGCPWLVGTAAGINKWYSSTCSNKKNKYIHTLYIYICYIYILVHFTYLDLFI